MKCLTVGELREKLLAAYCDDDIVAVTIVDTYDVLQVAQEQGMTATMVEREKTLEALARHQNPNWDDIVMDTLEEVKSWSEDSDESH